MHFDYPALKGFDYEGGSVMSPEFVALLLARSAYAATFIAEIVRAGPGGGDGSRLAGIPCGRLRIRELRILDFLFQHVQV